MMISLMPETVDEDVDAPLETRGHSDDLAGAGQASDRRDDAAEPGRDDLDPIGDRADSLELVTSLARESTHVLGERECLTDQRAELLLHDGQDCFGSLCHASEGPDRGHQRHQQGKRRQRKEHLDPEGHGRQLY